MKQNWESAGQHALPDYAAPEVEVQEVCVEQGYSSSYAIGSDGSVSIGGDYSWGSETEF